MYSNSAYRMRSSTKARRAVREKEFMEYEIKHALAELALYPKSVLDIGLSNETQISKIKKSCRNISRSYGSDGPF